MADKLIAIIEFVQGIEISYKGGFALFDMLVWASFLITAIKSMFSFKR